MFRNDRGHLTARIDDLNGGLEFIGLGNKTTFASL